MWLLIHAVIPDCPGMETLAALLYIIARNPTTAGEVPVWMVVYEKNERYVYCAKQWKDVINQFLLMEQVQQKCSQPTKIFSRPIHPANL